MILGIDQVCHCPGANTTVMVWMIHYGECFNVGGRMLTMHPFLRSNEARALSSRYTVHEMALKGITCIEV